ncbi:RedY protein [Hahella aquimaris]|uniref:RedY protein n=1 Tax=Hahella sp. HNIBRBA332 TaxID=3015983 RepID=UPI00273C7745|nr:RedY protein [Hahella sp. HNIBRBA332]WLQ13963.1 RedY protein [Hahella sp. HNIBRBA332]
METIIHKIRLLDVAKADVFETWVQNVDYATCPDLHSVVRFDVHRASLDPAAPYHYLEVIKITDRAAFDADMATATFAGLVQAFSRMAEVVEELAGEQLGSGYAAG